MFNIGSEYCILCTQDSDAFLMVVSLNVFYTALSEIHRFYNFSNLNPSVLMLKHSWSPSLIYNKTYENPPNRI